MVCGQPHVALLDHAGIRRCTGNFSAIFLAKEGGVGRVIDVAVSEQDQFQIAGPAAFPVL
jgi:hypothetical protein